MSSKKILITIIAIQLVIGIIQTIANNPETTDFGIITNMSSDITMKQNSLNTEEGLFGTLKQTTIYKFVDTTIINGIKLGTILIQIIFNSLNPFSITPSYSAFQNIFIYPVIIFKIGLTTIMLVTIYQLFKNKSTD